MPEKCLIRKGVKLFIAFLLMFFSKTIIAQQIPVTDSFKVSTIEKINSLLKDNYIFPDIALKTAAHLNEKVTSGWLKTIPSLDSFSRALTREIYTSSKDKHLRLRPSNAPPPPRLTDIGVKGFKEAKILEGNIGYVDIRLFVPGAERVVDSVLKLVQDAKAIIIDLRNNAGGVPEMVQYLCSYFFDEKILLNSSYTRISNTTREFWTTAVNGRKLTGVPLYILTSNFTFSAGEEFCYDMQTQKRATLIGETTGGGANPGRVFKINSELDMFIPLGRAINPVTGTNWEGNGVKPEIMIPSKEAYNKAIEIATKSSDQ